MVDLRIPESLIEIGILQKPFGVTGWIKVSLSSADPERLKTVRDVTLVKAGEKLGNYRISGIKTGDRNQYVQFESIQSREAASLLTGAFLCIEESQARKLDENEYFQHEIIGMDVVTPDGDRVGRIESILEIGPHDVYSVLRDDGTEVLIPGVRDIVIRVDRNRNQMTIDPPQGMLDGDTDDAI